MPTTPPTWITYYGGPLDGQLEKRPKGARLPAGRDDCGQSLGPAMAKHQRQRIASGRNGTRHYLLAPTDGDTAVYVHATAYRDYLARSAH